MTDPIDPPPGVLLGFGLRRNESPTPPRVPPEWESTLNTVAAQVAVAEEKHQRYLRHRWREAMQWHIRLWQNHFPKREVRLCEYSLMIHVDEFCLGDLKRDDPREPLFQPLLALQHWSTVTFPTIAAEVVMPPRYVPDSCSWLYDLAPQDRVVEHNGSYYRFRATKPLRSSERWSLICWDGQSAFAAMTDLRRRSE